MKYKNPNPPHTRIVHSGTCDMCNSEDNDTIYDAATRLGPWAWMCEKCFNAYSHHKLGTGFGQKYEKEEQPGDHQ